MGRFLGLVSFLGAALWAYKGEIVRALLYDRGFHLVGLTEPGFWGEWSVPALLVAIGLYLFWITGNKKLPRLKFGWGKTKGAEATETTDWSIRDLFVHIRPDLPAKASSTVGRASFDDLDKRWLPVGNEVIKQLSLGKLHASGREFYKITKLSHAAPIPAEFWRTAQFTYWFLDRLGTGILHTKNAAGVEYADVEVNRLEALSIWPSEPWPDFKKWDAKKLFELYEAACLWFNIEPRLPMPDRALSKYQEWREMTFGGGLPVESESVRHAIDKAMKKESSVTPHTLLAREILETLADHEGYEPLFLYPHKRGEKN